jgi:hypothetical protein
MECWIKLEIGPLNNTRVDQTGDRGQCWRTFFLKANKIITVV